MLATAEVSMNKMFDQIPNDLKDDISKHINNYCSQGYIGCTIKYGTSDSQKYNLDVLHGAVCVWLRSYGYNVSDKPDIGLSWIFDIDWIPKE